MLSRVVWWFTDVSEVLAATIVVAVMMAASTSKTSVIFYRTTPRNIPQDSLQSNESSGLLKGRDIFE
jgi:hypothetical protein